MTVARKWLGLMIGLLLVAPFASPAVAAPDNAQGFDVAVLTPYAGKVRDFHFYVAPTVPPLQPVPLLIVLHGLYSDPFTAEAASGFDAIANSGNIAVAYPIGLDGSWNAGTCCGVSSAKHVDDVGYLVHLASVVSAMRPIDQSRIYVAGFSNGGMMALRAECERPDVFAAAAAISGTLQADCTGSSPVSAILINGLQDKTVPFAGSRYSSFLHTALTPVPTTISTLAGRSHCTGQVTVTHALFSDTNYQGCAAATGVELVKVNRVGHHWPTQQADGVDAQQLAWSFLTRHKQN